MNWVALSFLGTVGVVIVAACIVALLVRHRFNRHHRVHPKVATDAPVTWLVDPRTPARLHRRLAKVGQAAGVVADDHRVARRRMRRAPEQPPLVGIAEDVRQQAVRLDHEVARVAMLSKTARRGPLMNLSHAVSDLEGACFQLITLSAEVLSPPVLASEDDDITNVAAQVERLAQAHKVLLEIDARSGLVPDATRWSPTSGSQVPEPTQVLAEGGR